MALYRLRLVAGAGIELVANRWCARPGSGVRRDYASAGAESAPIQTADPSPRRAIYAVDGKGLMEIRLDHFVIHVSERARSNAFYHDVLGAELVGDQDGVAMYRFGEQQLNVHGPGLEPHPVARLPVAPGGSDLCFFWPGPIDEAINISAPRTSRSSLGPCRAPVRAEPVRASISEIPTAAYSSSSPTADRSAGGSTGEPGSSGA